VNGVMVTVYRADERDCTAGGVTSPARAKGKTFIVFDPALASGNWSLDDVRERTDVVCLKLVRRQLAGGEYIHAEPIFWSEPEVPHGRPMCGGNFIFTSDSRFRRVCEYPIPVHDRFETA